MKLTVLAKGLVNVTAMPLEPIQMQKVSQLLQLQAGQSYSAMMAVVIGLAGLLIVDSYSVFQ